MRYGCQFLRTIMIDSQVHWDSNRKPHYRCEEWIFKIYEKLHHGFHGPAQSQFMSRHTTSCSIQFICPSPSDHQHRIAADSRSYVAKCLIWLLVEREAIHRSESHCYARNSRLCSMPFAWRSDTLHRVDIWYLIPDIVRYRVGFIM